MPHTNRKKKTSTNPNQPTKSRSTITQHTKRTEIQDDEGWVHVIDTPRSSRGRSSTLNKKAGTAGFHTGDFEIDGVPYVQRTLDELREEVKFWRKGWIGGEGEGVLRDIFGGKEIKPVEEEKESLYTSKVLKENNTVEAEAEAEAQAEAEIQVEATSATQDAESPTPADIELKSETSPEISTSTAAPVSNPKQRKQITNIIVLGLGSLQSARREGRRASATQLAALQTIIETLCTLSSLI